MGGKRASLASSLDCVQSGPACCACGEQIEMYSAVYRVAQGGGEDVGGPEAVPGMRPGTSVSAVWSQDWAAA